MLAICGGYLLHGTEIQHRQVALRRHDKVARVRVRMKQTELQHLLHHAGLQAFQQGNGPRFILAQHCGKALPLDPLRHQHLCTTKGGINPRHLDAGQVGQFAEIPHVGHFLAEIQLPLGGGDELVDDLLHIHFP